MRPIALFHSFHSETIFLHFSFLTCSILRLFFRQSFLLFISGHRANFIRSIIRFLSSSPVFPRNFVFLFVVFPGIYFERIFRSPASTSICVITCNRIDTVAALFSTLPFGFFFSFMIIVRDFYLMEKVNDKAFSISCKMLTSLKFLDQRCISIITFQSTPVYVASQHFAIRTQSIMHIKLHIFSCIDVSYFCVSCFCAFPLVVFHFPDSRGAIAEFDPVCVLKSIKLLMASNVLVYSESSCRERKQFLIFFSSYRNISFHFLSLNNQKSQSNLILCILFQFLEFVYIQQLYFTSVTISIRFIAIGIIIIFIVGANFSVIAFVLH